MNKYKDNYEFYQSVFDEVHASDELLRKVQNMTEAKTNKINFKAISAIAACLVAVILVTAIFGNFGGGENFFVLKASAAEIGSDSLVKIGDISPVGGYSDSTVSGYNHEYNIGSTLPFAVNCDGRNIKSIKYTIKNGVFIFPPYQEEYREMYTDVEKIIDKIYNKTEVKDKLKSPIDDIEQYVSYTINYEDQLALEKLIDLQTSPSFFVIGIYSMIYSNSDETSKEARYALLNVMSSPPDPNGGHAPENRFDDEGYMDELMDAFQTVYDEMYSKITITAEVTFTDGTKDSETLRLGCESVTEETGITIGAKIINNSGE